MRGHEGIAAAQAVNIVTMTSKEAMADGGSLLPLDLRTYMRKTEASS